MENTHLEKIKDNYSEYLNKTNDFSTFMKDYAKSQIENTKNYIKNNWHEQDRNPIYSTDHEVIYKESYFRILKFSKNPENSNPFLIVPSLINRYYILDLMENNSFVKFLAEKGINIYVLDWGIPGYEHDHLSLNFYIEKWINRAVNKVLKDSNSKSLTLGGYCMGATISAIYTAMNQDKVNGFVSFAAPYDFENDDSLTILAKEVNVDKMVDAFGNVPEEVIQFGFTIAQPTNTYYKMKSLYDNNDNEKRNVTFMHLERWLNDNVPFPKTAYKNYINTLYKGNQLSNGEYEIAGKKVSLNDISVPVLNVIALQDGIVPHEAAKALTENVSSKINDTIEINAGHIGIMMGRKAKEAWQNTIDWFKKVNKI